MSAKDKARLRCSFDSVHFLKPKTLILPWWPSEIQTSRQGQWTEQARPGDLPVLLLDSPKVLETRVSYLLRERDATTSVQDHIDWLFAAQSATSPVALLLGSRLAGLYRLQDLSVVEVLHNEDGNVSIADVSLTLNPAVTATMNVGPVKRKKKPKGNRS